MAPGPTTYFYLISTVVLCVVPVAELLPVRFRDIDPRLLPTIMDPVVTTTIPQAKPDPLENIGVEPSKGYLIEGDIRIWHGFPTQERKHTDASTSGEFFGYSMRNSHQIRNSVGSEETWLEKVIPYEIDQTFNSTERQIILAAIDEVMAGVNRCIQFVPREKQEDFLYITGQQSGCWSDIGKQGGNQTVSISRASECVSKGIIMHELLHALGFWHEHNRPDRDKYIEILVHNIRMDHLDDFTINPNGKTLTAYDYYSIMHYKINQFSKSSVLLNTIRIIQPGIDETKVGQREYLSDKDKERIVLLYQCKNMLRSSVDSLQSKLYPNNEINALWPSTRTYGAAIETLPGNEALGAMITSTKGTESQKVLVQQTPTVNTNIEAVSEKLKETGTTKSNENELIAKSNLTETAQIGRK